MAEFSNQLLKLQKAIRQQVLTHKRFAEQQRQFIDSLQRSIELPSRHAEELLRRQRQFADSFRQLDEIPKRFAEQQRQFIDSLQRSIELPSRHAEELLRRQRQFVDSFRQLDEIPKRFAEQQRQTLESFRRLADELKELPERDRKALQRLGEEGWFLDPEIPAILLQQLELLFDEHPDEMTEWLTDFFRERLDVIEGKLVDSYPHRGHLFQQAFEAHREGKYGLSVPVFLAQADGIFWERTPERQNLFSSRQRKAYSEFASQISDTYTGIYLYPLSTLLPLWMNEDERGACFVGLNRHQVLHGESVDYATEQNSLKTISLLSYLHLIFSKNHEPKGDD